MGAVSLGLGSVRDPAKIARNCLCVEGRGLAWGQPECAASWLALKLDSQRMLEVLNDKVAARPKR